MKHDVQTDEYYGFEDYMAMLPAKLQAMLSSVPNMVSGDARTLDSVLRAYNMTHLDSVALLTMDSRNKNLVRFEVYVGSAENLLHEMGHVLDASGGDGLQSYSGTDEFREIYEKEKDKSGYNTYLTSNTYEYFAESFLSLILENNQLETGFTDARPLTAAYLRKAAGIGA